MSSSYPPPPTTVGPWLSLADFFRKQLQNPAHNIPNSAERPLNPKSNSGNPFDEGRRADAFPRYYVVMTSGGKALSPESIQVMDVTQAIPRGCMVKARAFCSGVAFNFNFSANNHFMNRDQPMKVKLCVIGGLRNEDPTVVDLDLVGSSKIPDPSIIHALGNSPPMKALVSSVKDTSLSEFVGLVGTYVGTKFGEEKKAEYLKMVESSSISTSILESVEIWLMLTLQDRVMEALMKTIPLPQFVKMPITIDIPSASAAIPTPGSLGWKPDPTAAEGLRPRPCIPDHNQVFVDLLEEEDEEEETHQSTVAVAEEEGNYAKKRKAGGEGTE